MRKKQLILFSFSLTLLMTVVVQTGARAQGAGTASEPNFLSQAPMLPGVAFPVKPKTTPSEPLVPLLQGASCGTIGPPGADATIISGVNSASKAGVPPPGSDAINIIIDLIAAAVILAFMFGRVRSTWVIAAVVASVAVVTGFANGLLSRPPL